jgi:hypothetical protein
MYSVRTLLIKLENTVESKYEDVAIGLFCR